MVLLVGDQVAETMPIAKQPVQLPLKMLALVMQQWANSIDNQFQKIFKILVQEEVSLYKA